MRLVVIVLGLFSILESCQRLSPPAVVSVYPTSDTLPENLLRMYVKFSKPMKAVGNLDKVRLIDAHDQEIHGAIFNNAYELWNQDQQILTLLLDPARVKTGLEAHKKMGRALQPENTYQLVIEGLEDVNHQKMQERFIKEIYIVAADTTPTSIDLWIIKAPEAGSLTGLQLHFPHRLDWFSMQQRLGITNNKREIIPGSVVIKDHEKSWNWIPKKPWQSDNYILHINARLEDPSGNNLNGLFDHEPGALNYQSEDQVIELPITIAE